jgi:hypothetical protein
MPTLFLLAPQSRNNPSGHQKDFHTIFSSGVGPDYGIWQRYLAQINSGMRVVVFDRDRRLQAEGVVTSYAPTSKASNGVQRYDIKIGNLVSVPYSNPPKVNHFGVAIY